MQFTNCLFALFKFGLILYFAFKADQMSMSEIWQYIIWVCHVYCLLINIQQDYLFCLKYDH